MHHPMTRRTVGEIKVLEAWRSSKKLVPVGPHFIQSCHTICPVNSKRRKLWHTLFRTGHNFFDPPLLEGRIEWIACRIVHWQQQEYSSIASAKVKTVIGISSSRRFVGYETATCLFAGVIGRAMPAMRPTTAAHAPAALTTLPMRYASFEVRTSLTRVDDPRSSIEKPEH